MSGATSIEWCDTVWNPVTGCTKVSAGCKNCYAEAVARRFWKGRKFGDVQCHEDRLGDPLKWRKPRRVFVNSMSDLFHEDVPDDFIGAVMGIAAACPQHTFIVLTKRPEAAVDWYERTQAHHGDCIIARCWGWSMRIGRIEDFAVWPGSRCWPLPNVQIGVSVEDQATADERIPLLLQIPAARRIVSYEPALGPVDFSAYFSGPYVGLPGDVVYANHNEGIDQVIVGGESGPQARPCNVEWIRSTIRQCKAAGVPCFVKQLGSRPVSPSNCRMRTLAAKGNDMSEWPADLRVREMVK